MNLSYRSLVSSGAQRHMALLLCLLLSLTAFGVGRKLTGTTMSGNRWTGLDLGNSYVINQVAYTATNGTESEAMVLGLFEGANQPDFSDALPLFMITEPVKQGKFSYTAVKVTRSFRYVRFVGLSAKANPAPDHFEFWGYYSVGTDRQFYQVTNLPTLVITTTNGQEPQDKVNEISSVISVISDEGRTIQETEGSSRLRGNYTLSLPKKPYRIKFAEKQHILDSPAKAKKWALLADYGDKSLMRNALAFEISRRMGMPYTPWDRPVDVIFNHQYKGTYHLTDVVDVRKHRVHVEEMDSSCIEGEDLTGGYLVEIDAYGGSEPRHFTSSRKTLVTVKYPDSDDILDVQFEYIRQHFNDMERAVYNGSTWKDPELGYRRYLDLSSFHRRLLCEELAGNVDQFWSVYLYKERGDDRFYVAPIWDFDIAFDNDTRAYPTCNMTDFIYRTSESTVGSFNKLVERIMLQDTQSMFESREAWAEARYFNGLTPDDMGHFIDSLAKDMDASQRLNFIRWPIMQSHVAVNPVIRGSYEAEVQCLKDYMRDRIAWMDRKLRYDESTYEDGMPDLSADAPHVMVSDRRLYVSAPTATPYQVFSLTGLLEAEGMSGQAGPTLTAGAHIVRTAGISQKIVVR